MELLLGKKGSFDGAGTVYQFETPGVGVAQYLFVCVL